MTFFLYIYFLVTIGLWLKRNFPSMLKGIKRTVQLAKVGYETRAAMEAAKPVPLTLDESKALKAELEQANAKVDLWRNKFFDMQKEHTLLKERLQNEVVRADMWKSRFFELKNKNQ